MTTIPVLPGPRTRADEPKNISSRREREFLRYAEAVYGLTGWRDSEHAVSSRDVTLTAFAQLVALRLNAKRALITLFDKTYQYFLAEATRTLSLQEDGSHEPGDGLYWGQSVVVHHKGLNSQAMYPGDQLPQHRVHGAAIVYPNLLEMERYANHPHVQGAPWVRSYAGVPLLSPSGFAVGTLSILDNKPRPNLLTHLEVKYMQDVATSVMAHMELRRTKAVYERGLKMAKGLSRFMEGTHSHEDDRAPRDGSRPLSVEANPVAVEEGSTNSTTLSTRNSIEQIDHAVGKTASQRPSFPHRPLAPVRKRSKETTPTVRKASETVQQFPIAKQMTPPSDWTLTAASTPEDQVSDPFVSKNIAHAFQRAAGIIQDAMDMAGVLFLGASAGALGSLQSPNPDGSASDGGASTTAGSDDALPPSKPDQTDTKLCRPLAAAYKSSVDEAPPFVYRGISEKFFRSLLRRFPFGRIWNFSDDELLSSDEHSDGSAGAEPRKRKQDEAAQPTTASTKRKRLRSDHEKILEMFPGVRSFGIMPLWDSQRQRFFAGAIIWSYDASRMFSVTDEINYVGAFCDVIMAEISKMDFQADAMAKTTFISSITHELRSPLHGILGAVEVLQEAQHSVSDEPMLQMIDTCGRSLLDIINNLLDRAQKPAKRIKSDGNKRRKRRNIYQSIPPDKTSDMAILTEEVLDSVLWLTPEPAPQSQTSRAHSNIPSSDEPVKVAFEVDQSDVPASGWNFHVNAGAWRRIVQNLASNSIKYTDKGGYCKVVLSISKPTSYNDPATSMVELTCADSGRGMSREYLDNGLWQEFQQEENNVQGTGLGLSLVRNLVEEMGGTIDVESTKWVGTTIKVSLPLFRATETTQPSALQSDDERLRGLSFDLRGFDTDSASDNRTAEATQVMRDSLIKSCRALGMDFQESGASDILRPDVYILSEGQASSEMELDGQDATNQASLVVICHSASSSRAFTSHRPPWLRSAVIVAQPLGPQKLRKALLAFLTPSSSVESDMNVRDSKRLDPRLPSYLKPPREISAIAPRRDDDKSPVAILLTDDKTINPPSVLLVDDNPVNLSLLQRSMEKMGRSHISATNGREAVEAYQQSLAIASHMHPENPTTNSTRSSNPVKIIFMDITMPVMDGLESTRRIRAYERSMKLKPAKIAALTALASPQARQEAYSSGIDLFLTKPVRFKEIQEILASWEGGESAR